MAVFNLMIAGRVGTVHSLFESTKDYCGRYLTAEPGEFTVEVTKSDLLAQQEALLEEARQEGIRKRIFTDPFLERTAIQEAFADHLFHHDILLCHGSTVAVDGRAYLFTAKCGTGKSTHTRLWRQVFGDRAQMVNDDKPFLKLTDTGVLACGAPWSGKHGLDTNITVPLGGICILERGPENTIQPITPAEALPRLLHETYCPTGQAEQFEKLVTRLAETVPLWRMTCTKDPQAAQVAFEAMSAL